MYVNNTKISVSGLNLQLRAEKPSFARNFKVGTSVAMLTVKYLFSQMERYKIMSEENSTGSNLIWAVAMIIIVAIIAGAAFYSGMLSGNKKQDIDVEIKVPATNSR